MNSLVRTPRDPTAARRLLLADVLSDDVQRRVWLERILLRPGQVAVLFQVTRRSVAHWAGAGLLPSIRTPGGHRRFRASDVRALIDSLSVQPGGWSPDVPGEPRDRRALQ